MTTQTIVIEGDLTRITELLKGAVTAGIITDWWEAPAPEVAYPPDPGEVQYVNMVHMPDVPGVMDCADCKAPFPVYDGGRITFKGPNSHIGQCNACYENMLRLAIRGMQVEEAEKKEHKAA